MISFRSLTLLIVMLVIIIPSANAQYADVTFDVGHINNCVYEVVVPKPEIDSLTYEKPLPMDLLPFKIRNDKYYSIGTAFASSETEFVTGSHVLNLGVGSHFKEVLLRDVKGNVFGLDKIIKYSSRRDFVVFTVKGRQSPEFLIPNLKPETGEKVYAVGNALGQGVVIRDGLYTSNTPEETDGKWDWIRFSAAASPGNSGGPLLDKNGKVVGLVLSKSQSENLNSALPMAEVIKDYQNNAEVYQKATFGLEIFDFMKTAILDTTIKLPMSYDEFSKVLRGKYSEFFSKSRQELLSENKSNTFPEGSGSNKVMYANNTNFFPQLITRREGGNWEPGFPQNVHKTDLDNNGRIGYGAIKITVLAKIDMPDNVSLKNLCSDSKLFMDLLLKAINVTRQIGPEKIRIISLGKADNEYIHKDAYGRKWLVKTWPMEYSDQEVACFILPAPDGCAVMTKVGQTGMVLDDHVDDMKVLANFINLSYGGTFKQWDEFLAMKDIIPDVFSTIDIKSGSDSFQYKSKRFKTVCDSSLSKISDKSFLALGFGYYKEGDSVIWDVNKMNLSEGRFEKGGFGVGRFIRPVDNNEKYVDSWQKLVEGKNPFDKQILIKDDTTRIATVCAAPESPKPNADCSVLYDVSYTKSGVIDQKEMETALGKFLSGVVVYEN